MVNEDGVTNGVVSSGADVDIDFKPASNGGSSYGAVYDGTNGDAKMGAKSVNDNDAKSDDSDEKKEEEQPKIPVLKLFRFATGLDGLFMVIGTFAAMAHGCGWPVLNVVFGGLIDEFVELGKNYTIPNSTVTPPSPEEALENFDSQMREYAIIFSYIGAAVLVMGYLQVSMWTLSCERQIYKIRRAFFDAILHQEMQWFDVHKSGELTSRLADDMERIKDGIGDKIGLSIQYFSLFIAGFGIAFWKSWEMTLVLLAMTPLLAIAGAFMAYLLTNFSKKEQESYAGAGSVAEEVLSCIRTVIAFGGEQKEVDRYEQELQTARDVGVRKGVTTGVGMGLTMFIMFGSYALAFWYGPKLVADGVLTGGDVMIVFFCVMIGSFSIGNVSPAITAITAARGSGVTIFEVIDNRPAIDTRLPSGVKPKEMKGNVEFRNVFFSYPTRPDVPVLQGVNLSVKMGQTVALVGSSGCGKSTTINLLLRFYDKAEGRIIIDGNEITDLNLAWLRQHIGVVSQEPVLFNCSIEQNISYGREGVTKEEIIQAAKMANAHDYISKLPNGYDTMVGERGAQLSGGQKQRVAIARALVRNPPILLLDEATSALDRESEKVVQQALDKASEGRTTIVIAHRLTTIRNADIIYAFDQGKVVEFGNHEELIKKDGVYKQLVTLQTLDSEVVDSKELARKESIKKEPIRQVSSQLSRQISSGSFIKGKEGEVEEIVEEEVASVSYTEILKMNKPEWMYIAVGCFFSGCLGVAMPAFAILFSEIIVIFSYPPEQMREEAVFWSCMFLVLGAGFFICNSMTGICFAMSGEELTLRLRRKAFWTMLRQDVAYFDQPAHSTGALSTRLATDASNVKGATGIRIGTIFQAMSTMAVALGIGFYFGWQLALLIFGCLPVLAISGALEMKALQGGHEKDSALIEEAGKIASEAIENIRTVAGLNLEDLMIRNYAGQLENPYKQGKKNSQVNGLAFGFSQSMIFFIYAASFRLGGYLVYIGEMSGDEVFKVVFGVAFAGISVGQAMAFLPDFAKARHSADMMLHLFKTKPLIDNYSTAGLKPKQLEGEIRYSNLQFTYPSRPDVKILKGLNLTIKPGQTVALVGESGCGKSTLVSLLERFYDTAEGSVSVDGKSVKDLNIKWLRANMAIVSQEPILFACSIRENIQYGVEEEMDMASIERVAKMANIHDFIASLPTGYDTLVGEKGAQLSGGQKQRVAIARALARDPRILLLDEATSALDTESEKVVQAALDNATMNRTSIVIAHRLSTVQNADVIAVVREGVIVEAGSHQELLKMQGHYYTLTGGKRDS